MEFIGFSRRRYAYAYKEHYLTFTSSPLIIGFRGPDMKQDHQRQIELIIIALGHIASSVMIRRASAFFVIRL